MRRSAGEEFPLPSVALGDSALDAVQDGRAPGVSVVEAGSLSVQWEWRLDRRVGDEAALQALPVGAVLVPVRVYVPSAPGTALEMKHPVTCTSSAGGRIPEDSLALLERASAIGPDRVGQKVLLTAPILTFPQRGEGTRAGSLQTAVWPDDASLIPRRVGVDRSEGGQGGKLTWGGDALPDRRPLDGRISEADAVL